MKLLRAIVAAVLFAASFHAVAAAAQGYEVQEADLDKWITKNNAYVKLLNESLRARDSWDRYLSWVNLERGPTGKERIIYGLYSVGASSAKESIAAARKAADSAPSAPALDAAAKELAATFETVFPIMNEANDYYDRKDYMSDNASGAKRLHGQLVPAARAFMAARDKMENLQEELKDKLDGLELARIEKTEGKQYRWHMKRTMTLAKKAFDHYPRDIVGRLREIKEKIAKRQADPTFYSMDYNGVVSSYNTMIDMARMPAFGR